MVQKVKASRDELSSLKKNLKISLQDAKVQESLARVGKTAVTGRIKTMLQESKALLADKKSLQKLFEEIFAVRPDGK